MCTGKGRRERRGKNREREANGRLMNRRESTKCGREKLGKTEKELPFREGEKGKII